MSFHVYSVPFLTYIKVLDVCDTLVVSVVLRLVTVVGVST